MIGVTGCAVSYQFRIDFRVSCLCMLQLFQDNDSCAFAHHETVAVLIKRNRSSRRIFRIGQCSQAGKTCHAQRTDAALCTSRHTYVRIPVLDRAECVSDGMGAAGTCRHNAGTFSFRSQVNGNVSCRHIGDHHRNRERIYFGRLSRLDLCLCRLAGLQVTDAGTDDHAYAVRILVRHIQPCVRESLT